VGDAQPHRLDETLGHLSLASVTSRPSALLLVAARRVAGTEGQITSELDYAPTSPRDMSIVCSHILIHKSGRADLRGEDN
jgi:hypothetical protein